MRLALASLVVLLLLAVPAAAKPVTETAAAGNLRAEFAYDTRKQGPPKDLVARVFVDDQQIVERAFPDKDLRYPANLFLDKRSVTVRDFDGDGTPEALFDTYTGGAHCCVESYLYDGATEVELYTGNVGYSLEQGNVFRTADDGFSNRYSSFAASQQPFQVLAYRDGKFVDITRAPQYVGAIKREIRRFKRDLRVARRRTERDPAYAEGIRSTLAGITADYCNLGVCEAGYGMVDAAIGRGDVEPSFRRQLRRDLREDGYDR